MKEKFRKIVGYSNLLFEKEDLYPYAYDTSPNSDDIKLPKYVLFPQTVKQVSEIMKLCTKENIADIP